MRSAEFEHTSDLHEMPSTPEEMHRLLEVEEMLKHRAVALDCPSIGICGEYERFVIKDDWDGRTDLNDASLRVFESGHFDIRPIHWHTRGNNVAGTLLDIPTQRMKRVLRRR